MPLPRHPVFRPGYAAAVVAVLLLALLVRVIGLHHGAPDLIFHPDVAKQAAVAIRVYDGTLDLERHHRDNYELSIYPYGTAVLLGTGLKVLSGFQIQDWVTDVNRWRWAVRLRYLSVGLWLVALLALLLVEHRRLTTAGALGMGFLLALEPIIAQHGHYGMNDVPLAACLVLAWLVAMQIPSDRSTRPWRSLLCGLLLGMAVGMKYQGLLGLLFPAVAWLWVVREKSRGWRLAIPLAVALGFVSGALFSCPVLHTPAFFLQEFPKFMAWQANITGQDLSLGNKLGRNLGLLLRFSLRHGYVLLLLPLVAGLRRTCWREHGEAVRLRMVSALTFALLLTVAFLTSRDFLRTHDLVAVLPFVLIPLGYELSRPGRKTAKSVTMALVLAFAVLTLRNSLAFHRTDTQVRARAWCREHMDHGVLLREMYTLETGLPGVQDNMVRWFIRGGVPALIEQGGPDYLITSSRAHARFYDRLSPFYSEEGQALYNGLTNRYRLAASFSDRRLDFAQPTVKVYVRRTPGE